MYNGKTILAIVTARGGSKGLPGKNIKVINGKPLISWTLERAKESKYIDFIYVSTDDIEIANVCESFNVPVPELRPEYLATDTASSMDVLEYSIDSLNQKGMQFDYLILLEPTSPLRKKDDLDKMIELAVNDSTADGVISLGKVSPEHPSIIKKIDVNNYISKYVDSIELSSRRQEEDDAFFPYGVGYLIKTEVFKKKKTIYTDKMLPYFIERWQNYEIDDIFDFLCIEAIMKEMNYE